MAHIFTSQDGNLSVLQDRVISILGYGNQGRASALNFRDSGVRVVVGNRRDASFDLAAADGFEAYDIPGAVQQADCHYLLVPDEIMPQLFEAEIRPYLKPGHALIVASGYNISYGFLKIPPDIDLLLIAPRMIGTGVRRGYVDGTGFPSLVAVHQDATGRAEDLLLALCSALGTLLRGAVQSSCDEETLCDLYSEHSGHLYALRRGYELLVEAGASSEAAMLELWASGEEIEVARVIMAHGLFGQLPLHSQTSQYGQEVTARLSPREEEQERDRLRKLIADIQDGTFAKDWALERLLGYPVWKRVRGQNLSHPMIALEERLRRLLGIAPDQESQ